MVHVQFATLAGKFAIARRESFPTMEAARAAVEQHIAGSGYGNLKEVADVDSIRFTATTPGGRGGRNVAFLDYDWEES